jgi:hypothetical protein
MRAASIQKRKPISKAKPPETPLHAPFCRSEEDLFILLNET